VSKELRQAVALVTGAAGAIGKGIARDFCRLGAEVFVTDLEPGAVEATVRDLAGDGTCQGLAANVTDEAQVRRVVQAAADAFGGRVDVLVNVAGVVATGKVETISEDEWDHVFAVNCKGSFFFIKHVVPLMKTAGEGGRIINFSSKSGKTGSALMTHYSGAKAAVIGMTQALAYELAADGITVNCLCPGITEATGVWDRVSGGYVANMGLSRDEVVTKFTAKVPLGRLATVADVVAVTRFLASPGADYMTGQAINVTGGREMH